MDPLNLTAAMRTAYDRIRSEGAVKDGDGVSLYTVTALLDRGLILLDMTGRKSKDRPTWVARPLGSGPLPKNAKRTNATAVSVSACLRRYRDENGESLRKFPYRDKSGNPDLRGYAVQESGQTNRVYVCYTTARGYIDPQDLTERSRMLKIYAEILRGNGYDVVVKAGIAYVSRPAQSS